MPETFDLNSIFYVLASIFVLAYLIYGFFIVYHLHKFGVGFLPKIFAVVFIIGSIFILGMVLTNIRHLQSTQIDPEKIFRLFRYPI